MGKGLGPGLFRGTEGGNEPEVGEFYGAEGSKLPRLPNAEHATIRDEKLTKYALDPNSKSGGADKARVFKSALGFDQSNADQLKAQILSKLPNTEAAVTQKTEYGQKFEVDLEIEGVNGNVATVKTAWIIRTGTDIPDLTTIYVKRR
jgi:hypothetical protein